MEKIFRTEIVIKKGENYKFTGSSKLFCPVGIDTRKADKNEQKKTLLPPSNLEMGSRERR